MRITIFKSNILLSGKLVIILTLLFAVFSIASAQESKDKKKARISLECKKTNEAGRQLMATVKTKVDRSYQNVSGVEVKFYFDEAADDNLIGLSTTDEKGVATIELPENFESMADSLFMYTFIASIENNETYRDKKKKLTVQESKLTLNLERQDSVNQAVIFFRAPDSTGIFAPKEQVAVNLFVQRMFGNLPIGEGFESTDEEGRLVFDFPTDLPGDENGNLIIVAQIESDDNYGTVEIKKMIQWGVPNIIDYKINERELWAARSNVPISLLLIVNGMIIGIWGTIIYVVFQIFKIKKLGKQPT